jgi:protein-S-isoprenylcysteine O-methyltransferase Ste14
MTYFFEAVEIILLFVFLFGILHSVMASNKIKNLIKEKAGSKIAFYRLFYNVTSVITFYVFYKISPKPGIVIYDLNNPFDIIVTFLQLASLAGIYWAGTYICIKEFIGINQIKRYFLGAYKEDDLDESSELTFAGPFAHTRHPIYFFSILFLALRPTMSFFYLIMFICIVAYFYIGSYYEEKRLLEKFGDLYADYKNNVPKIFPWKFKGYRIED